MSAEITRRVHGSVIMTVLMVALTCGCGAMSEQSAEPSTPASISGDEQTEAQAAQEESLSQPDAEPQEPVGQTTAAAESDQVAADYEDTDPSALTQWHDDLAGYGTWADDPVYGTIWVPDPEVVGSDYAPYVTGGHWGLTTEGDWTWVSDYPWGWITYHYGRWTWIPAHGWAWIAGRRYAPAWVQWRVGYGGYDYLGWAPMPPYWYWSYGSAVWFSRLPPAAYVFCHSHYIFDEHWHSHMVRGTDVGQVASHTRPYQPANPSVGGASNGGHQPASPSVDGASTSSGRQPANPSIGGGSASDAHRFAKPAPGPTMAAAHIPDTRIPRTRVSPEPRALAVAHPPPRANADRGAPGSSSERSFGSTARPSWGLLSHLRASASSVGDHSTSAVDHSATAPSRSFGSTARPSWGLLSHARGDTGGTVVSRPSYAIRSSPSAYDGRSHAQSHPFGGPEARGGYRAPSYGAPSSHMPSMGGPPHSSPSFSSPSHAPSFGASAPSYAPSPSYHAPSASFAPSPSYHSPSSSFHSAPAAPSYHPSAGMGGGSHHASMGGGGGGGRHR